MNEGIVFKKIVEAAKNGNYALRPHAVTHMLAEGLILLKQ